MAVQVAGGPPVTVQRRPNGTVEWRKGEVLHRGGDLPAVVRPDGALEWWREGVRDRGGDLPAIVTAGAERSGMCAASSPAAAGNLPTRHRAGTSLGWKTTCCTGKGGCLPESGWGFRKNGGGKVCGTTQTGRRCCLQTGNVNGGRYRTARRGNPHRPDGR